MWGGGTRQVGVSDQETQRFVLLDMNKPTLWDGLGCWVCEFWEVRRTGVHGILL